MNFRNISSWCIRNPVGPIVLFVGLMLAGLISFARMQVNNAPDIDFPAAFVSVSQPGAAPNEMETQVTQRVESAIRGVNNVDEIHSTVVEGNSTTFVSFQEGTSPDRAVNDVRNVVAQIRGTPVAWHYRRSGQPAASPKQHERRRRAYRDCRLRAVGSGARQRPGRIPAIANADRAAGRPVRQARRSWPGAGQQQRAALA